QPECACRVMRWWIWPNRPPSCASCAWPWRICVPPVSCLLPDWTASRRWSAVSTSPSSMPVRCSTISVRDCRPWPMRRPWGGVRVEDLAQQALRLDLRGERLSVDHDLPRAAQPGVSASSAPAQGGSSSTARPGALSNEPVLPLETLAGLNVHGSLYLQEVML